MKTYIKESDPRTRGSRIHQEQDYHMAQRHTFFPSTTMDWNLLPTYITSAPSLEAFRSHLGSSTSLQPIVGNFCGPMTYYLKAIQPSQCHTFWCLVSLFYPVLAPHCQTFPKFEYSSPIIFTGLTEAQTATGNSNYFAA